ncbi:MAG: heme o synthase [Bacteroidota bacterium]
MSSDSAVARHPSKLKVYMTFTKFRLSALVVLSALSGYLFAGGNDSVIVTYLMLGGLLVTAASNGTNQIIERKLDIKMKRTMMRPLPQGQMSLTEAYAVVVLFLAVGLVLLYMVNLYSALLGLAAYVSYAFIYTPLKPITPWAVFVGAFPGAIPPMLGYIAQTNDFDLQAGVLFFVQFCWQFPHFWAIAWVVHEDYQAGGFSLLPSKTGRTKESAFPIAVYSLLLIGFSLLPWILGWTGVVSLIVAGTLSVLFFWLSYRLYITCEVKDAKRLMFASFIYLPIIQFLYVFDKF